MTSHGTDLSRGLEGRLLGGKYRLGRMLGRGGMGIVLEAEHVALRRVVAVKLIRPGRAPSSIDLERFHLEAKTAARVAGDGVVQILDIDYDAELGPYQVLELIVGESLRERLRRGPIAPAESVGLMLQLLETLERVHEAGIVHRDIKPGNVYLRSSDGRVKVLDFGVASVLDPELVPQKLTVPGAMPGTPGYMAPEQMESGPIDRRTDVYAVAQVLYACLSGRPPLQGLSLSEVMARTLAGRGPDLRADRPGLPESLYQAVARASARHPAARTPSAAAFASELWATLSELERPPPSVPPTPISGVRMPRPDASNVPTLGSGPELPSSWAPIATGPSVRAAPEAWMAPAARSWSGPPAAATVDPPIPPTRGVSFGRAQPDEPRSRLWIAIPIAMVVAAIAAAIGWTIAMRPWERPRSERALAVEQVLARLEARPAAPRRAHISATASTGAGEGRR